MKRIVSLLLTAALLFSGCARFPLSAVASAYLYQKPQSNHTDLCFSDLADASLDAEAEIARVNELLVRVQSEQIAARQAQFELDERIEAYRTLRTDAAIAYVRYCRDVTDSTRKQAYEMLSVAVETLGGLLTDVQCILMRDPALSDVYDAKARETIARASALYDPSIRPLLERERALIGAYETLRSTFSIEYGGRRWTEQEILSDETLSYAAFRERYDAYCSAFNLEAGAIYLELIGVRNDMARTLGFPSYAEYGYACADRAYSPADAALFSERVQRDAVPLFKAMLPAYFDAAGRLYGAVFSEELTEKRVQTALFELLPELDEPWTYMYAHEMYDFGVSETRMPGSFTTYFDRYGAPFLFTSWNDTYEMPATLLHEFGHYARYYFSGAAGDPLDLAEIDSQGLELLATAAYDELYGALKDAAKTAALFFALYTLIDGCAEDAFERYAYGTEGVTLDDLNAAYGQICSAYGLDLLGSDGRSWVQIPHTFQSPMYYVSYAVSMVAALELFVLSERSVPDAVAAYRSILFRDAGAALSDTVRAAGLSDPIDPETVTRLMRDLDERITSLDEMRKDL